jgi:hypothetical protein
MLQNYLEMSQAVHYPTMIIQSWRQAAHHQQPMLLELVN